MADLARHPDVVDLAEYAEGVLDAARQSEVELHVRECPDCAETVADLAGLPETLAQAPVPPLPTEVAARLDRAIAAEASARAATPPAASRSTVVPIRPRGRWLKPVLAAAAVIGVIGLAVPVFNGGSDDAGGGESAASSSDDSGGSFGAERDGAVGAPDVAPGELPALSSDTFGRDVANTFFPGEEKSAFRLQAPEQLEDDLASLEHDAVHGLCPAPSAADLSSGRLEAITLDGIPAHLLIRRTGTNTEAIAFTCDGTDAQVLATATWTPG
jgi:hypothetical protein